MDLMDVLVDSISILAIVMGKSVVRDIVLHLSSEEDLREGKTDGVTILVKVLVLPLGLGVHEFVVHILSVND